MAPAAANFEARIVRPVAARPRTVSSRMRMRRLCRRRPPYPSLVPFASAKSASSRDQNSTRLKLILLVIIVNNEYSAPRESIRAPAQAWGLPDIRRLLLRWRQHERHRTEGMVQAGLRVTGRLDRTSAAA